MKKIVMFSLTFLLVVTAMAQLQVRFMVAGLPEKTTPPKEIYLAGSFNTWAPANADWRLLNDDNVSYGRTFTMAPGNYEYKLTRGSWDRGECGPKGADVGNRTLHLVHDTIIFVKIADWRDNYPVNLVKKHTASKNVHIIADDFAMPQLNKQRKIWIYLPTGYEAGKTKYPVIYMHDGQNLFDEATGNFGEWGVDEFLDSLKARQPKVIIVGIDNSAERMAEYSPYDSQYAKAKGDAYVSFLVETLKPYIDTHYRTLKDAKHTVIAGSSMGGLISMYAALKYPNVFGSAGIFSPAFWINQPIYDYAKTKAVKGTRYYFVCGDLESEKETNDMNKMVSILSDKGFAAKDIPSTIIIGAKHNEQQWRGDFPAFYAWLVKGF